MNKRLIEIEKPYAYFNKCACCKIDKETEKLTIGNTEISNSFVLCKSCRLDLYYKLKESLEGEINGR